MYSAHRNLDLERKRKEGNPCVDSIVFAFKNGNTFRIVEMIFNVKLDVVGFVIQLAVSKDATLHELSLEDFWNYFTTRKDNL